MAVKLHRCSTPWKAGPCWRVQKALDEQGIDYEVVRGPFRPGKRIELQRISGQTLYPVIQFEDGSTYREESTEMAATIRAGALDAKRKERPAPGGAGGGQPDLGLRGRAAAGGLPGGVAAFPDLLDQLRGERGDVVRFGPGYQAAG